MAQVQNASSSLNAQQASIASELEIKLASCADQLQRRDFNGARLDINSVEHYLAQLLRLKRIRRGHPRDRLIQEIHYYTSWQNALAGRLQLMKTNYASDAGHTLFGRGLVLACGLSSRFPEVKRYADLVTLIETWRDETLRHMR